jgi:hypothetical protein
MSPVNTPINSHVTDCKRCARCGGVKPLDVFDTGRLRLTRRCDDCRTVVVVKAAAP